MEITTVQHVQTVSQYETRPIEAILDADYTGWFQILTANPPTVQLCDAAGQTIVVGSKDYSTPQRCTGFNGDAGDQVFAYELVDFSQIGVGTIFAIFLVPVIASDKIEGRKPACTVQVNIG